VQNVVGGKIQSRHFLAITSNLEKNKYKEKISLYIVKPVWSAVNISEY
jgi:hypothetical protein